MLDEPTNPLDMESIDALARCLKAFKGGVIIISHDMRLIGQVAEEIWVSDESELLESEYLNTKTDPLFLIYLLPLLTLDQVCDNKKIERFNGDINKFKLHTKKENQKKLTQHKNG